MTALIPIPVRVLERRQESHNIFTLGVDRPRRGARFEFHPGQFNMLYLFGAGEIPISIASDPEESARLDHTIRIVGDVSRRLAHQTPGSVIGLRGPFGNPWPVQQAVGQDIVIITGGLGCAPTLSVVEYILRRRSDYGQLHILHGAKLPRDVIYRERFARWAKEPDTYVHLTVDRPEGSDWPHGVGLVTNLIRGAEFDRQHSIVMMCGPEVMMRRAADQLMGMGVGGDQIHVSIERNMKCAVGFCGHCQLGPEFVCKDGPVFPYARVRKWLETEQL